MSVVGTPKKVTLDGTVFDVKADANFNQIKGDSTNEEVVTSGRTIQKKTKRSQKIESVNLQADDEEAAILKDLSQRTFSYPMSYTLASGSIYRAVGFINFEGHDTETGQAVIQMIPESSSGWALF